MKTNNSQFGLILGGVLIVHLMLATALMKSAQSGISLNGTNSYLHSKERIDGSPAAEESRKASLPGRRDDEPFPGRLEVAEESEPDHSVPQEDARSAFPVPVPAQPDDPFPARRPPVPLRELSDALASEEGTTAEDPTPAAVERPTAKPAGTPKDNNAPKTRIRTVRPLPLR